MKISRVLHVGSGAEEKVVHFGEATTESETMDAYRLRYRVYKDRQYIDSAKYASGIEQDEYDLEAKCRYFIAVAGDKMIGCIRIIIDDPLPTEAAFSFEEPKTMESIPRNQRAELGRFIIVPLDEEKKIYLPRGLVMLFLLDSLSSYGMENHLFGGYSFVKRSLYDKLRKLKMPIGEIPAFKQMYPKDGVLYKYFSQPDDPVIPIYFLTKDFFDYSRKNIHRSLMFKSFDDVNFYLKVNLYTRFLRALKII